MSEIIIDGVDVSGCEYFEKHHYEDAFEDDCKVDIDNYCALCWNECKEQDCYYKQLKRIEQENERLKQSEQEGLEINAEFCMTEQRNKLKIALEEIRESCNNYARTEDFVIDQTFNEFLENISIIVDEVLKDE